MPQAGDAAPAMPKPPLWLWPAGAFGVVFILGLCIAGGIIALGVQAISPSMGGANSYESVEEMARDYESVYLPSNDSGLPHALSKNIRLVAIGIRNGGKSATIYCRSKGKLEKLTSASAAALVHEDSGARYPPSIRLSYTLEGNCINGDIWFKTNVPELPSEEILINFYYTLTDSIRYKKEG
jgi:hypothetical protein